MGWGKILTTSILSSGEGCDRWSSECLPASFKVEAKSTIGEGDNAGEEIHGTQQALFGELFQSQEPIEIGASEPATHVI